MHLAQMVEKNTPQFATGAQNNSAREALERSLERDGVRRQLVEQKLAIAVRLLREAMLCLSIDLLSHRMPVSERGDSITLNSLEVVRASARTFGSQNFTLGQLCARVAETFPGFLLDRKTVSRRLFDIREEENSVVRVVSVNIPPGHPVRKGRRYLYSYVGPPC